MDFSKEPDDSPKGPQSANNGSWVPAPDHVDPSVTEVDAEVTAPGPLPARESRGGGRRQRASAKPTEQRSGTPPTVPAARPSVRDAASTNGSAPTDTGVPAGGSASTQRPGPSPGERTTTGEEDPWVLRPRGLESERVLDRWNQVQSGFVDDPHTSIREADALAREVTEAVITALEEQRTALRATWDGAGDGDTEALRLALRDYRSFVRHLNGNTG